MNEEKLTFIEQTLQPKCHRLEAAVDPIVKSFGPGLVGWFDIESLPIMQVARRARVDTAVKVFSMGVPFNIANQVYDLGFPSLPWGDKGFLPFSLQPADAVSEPMPGEDGGGDTGGSGKEPDDDDKKTGFSRARALMGNIGQERKQLAAPAVRKPNTKLLWEHHMRQRRQSVKLFQGKVKKVLQRFRVKTLAALDASHLAKAADGSSKRSLVDIIFSATEFGSMRSRRRLPSPPGRFWKQPLTRLFPRWAPILGRWLRLKLPSTSLAGPNQFRVSATQSVRR